MYNKRAGKLLSRLWLEICHSFLSIPIECTLPRILNLALYIYIWSIIGTDTLNPKFQGPRANFPLETPILTVMNLPCIVCLASRSRQRNAP